MKLDNKRWSGSSNVHPLQDVMYGLDECIDALAQPERDIEFNVREELIAMARRVAIIATIYNVEMDEG